MAPPSFWQGKTPCPQLQTCPTGSPWKSIRETRPRITLGEISAGCPVLPSIEASVPVGGSVGCSGERCHAVGGYEGAQAMMERRICWSPSVLNPPCPIPAGGEPVALRTPFPPCPALACSKGLWGCRNLPPEISHVLWAVPAASSSCGGGMWSLVRVCLPIGTAAPRPRGLLSFLSFPSLQVLLRAPTSWRPLSQGNERQQSQNRM